MNEPIAILWSIFWLAAAHVTPATPARGPLVVHPDNPRYFMVKDDPAKKALYLTGSHVWTNLQRYRSEKPDHNIDFDEYLDTLTKYGHNFIRGWHWEDAYYEPLPFARTGPGLAKDGKPRFDLTKYNAQYFSRLRSRAVKAGRRGIYISIMLFEGWSFGDKGGGRVPNCWPLHPFGADNNINGVYGDPNGDGRGEELHTLASDGFGIDPKITTLQENYVKHTIRQLEDLDNIIWEISNESHPNSVNWQYHMIDLIHRYQAGRKKQHLVWMNCHGRDFPNSHLFDGPADVVSPHRFGPNFRNPPPSNGKKIVVLDTDHLWGVGGAAGWVWVSFTRGYHPIFMDPLHNIEWYKRSWNADNPNWVSIRRAMGQTLRYANKMDLAEAKPSPGLSTTYYCLANPPKEYLVFHGKPGTFAVTLQAGDYKYEWFNPATGKVAGTGTITATPGRNSFTPPFNAGAVLYLKGLNR